MAVHRYAYLAVCAAAVGAMIWTGVAGADSGEPVRATAAPAGVTVKSFQFMPADLTVPAGTTVTWGNQDKILHTVTSGKPGAPDNRFHGEMPDAGASYSTTLTAPGVYDYFCSRHESMIGRVTVQ